MNPAAGRSFDRARAVEVGSCSTGPVLGIVAVLGLVGVDVWVGVAVAVWVGVEVRVGVWVTVGVWEGIREGVWVGIGDGAGSGGEPLLAPWDMAQERTTTAPKNARSSDRNGLENRFNKIT